MFTRFGVRKVLFVAPVLAALAAVTAVARPATDVQTDAVVASPVVVVAGVAIDAVDEEAMDTMDAVDGDALMLVATNCTYYNNAAHTTVVGQFGYDCCNNPVAWGRKTRYSACGGCFPCVPPPQ